MMLNNKKEHESFHFWSTGPKNTRCFRWYKCIAFKLVVNLLNKGKLTNFSVEHTIGTAPSPIYCNFTTTVSKERKKFYKNGDFKSGTASRPLNGFDWREVPN